jgi:hypothetical protein
VGKRLLLVGLGLSATLPLSAYAQGNGTAVRTIEGAESGVHADILSLKRTEGGLLTLRIAFANDTGGEIKNKELPGGGNVENFKLVDFLNKRKYNVLRTNDGACLCTSLSRSRRPNRESGPCGQNSRLPQSRLHAFRCSCPMRNPSTISLSQK